MLYSTYEGAVGRMIGFMVHRREKLTAAEERAKNAFFLSLNTRARKTESVVAVAIVGLVGSGKSMVAKALAERIGAVVVEGDALRVALRKVGAASYDRARKIGEDTALQMLALGNSVIFDSDHEPLTKRASVREKISKTNAKFIVIRIVCDPDVAIGRILQMHYSSSPDDFWGGAKSTWTGLSKGAVVKIR